jgi:hypothetical protein
MSLPHFKFTGRALKPAGARKMVFEIDTLVLPKPAVVVEVPTVAPEPVAAAEVPTAAPLEVEPPAEVSQAAPETGLVPQDPPAK